MTMRVLMVSKACVVGIYQRKLELIAQKGIELCVVVPPMWRDERGDTPLERAFTTGYDLKVLPIRFNGNFHLHYYVGLGKVIRKFKPHIIHIDEEPYNLAAWQCLFHAKRIGAKTLFFSWQNIKRHYPPPFSWGERWVLNKIDYALMGTDSAGDIWREKGYAGDMQTVPQFGTDPAIFFPPPIRPKRTFTIGYIGRLVEEKGVFVLLDAVAKLGGDWQLKILGGGPLLDDLKARATSLNIADRVHFDGQLPSTQIPPYYHDLDLLVLPSLTRPNWKEQFGRVLVEAMASGVAVVGSDSGAIPSVIGDSGVIVPEGDATALCEAIEKIRADNAHRQDLIHKGLTRFRTNFTHEGIASATVKIYQYLHQIPAKS
ncbi:MAG: glycosyltransferase family 4 protein [Anaerolineae bacterium]|nr:glycosyltransferase family 4 protein [Anaerolineae bacterium]